MPHGAALGAPEQSFTTERDQIALSEAVPCPNVITVRRVLLPELDGTMYVANPCSMRAGAKTLKKPPTGVFTLCGGVLGWFEESQVRWLLALLADNVSDAELVLNDQSRLGKLFANSGLRRPS